MHSGKVILVRHGSTPFNHEDKAKDRIRGWIDLPLTAEGLKEVKATAASLRRVPIDMLYSSDLRRAKETAKEINKYHKLPVFYTTRARPWHLGVYEGQITKGILKPMEHMIQQETITPPDGEPFKEFRLRWLGFLRGLMRKAAYSGQTIVVATHFRNLKTANAWISKGKPASLAIDINCMLKDDFKPGDHFTC